MMHEPVEQGARHDLVAEEFGPRIEALVARNSDGAALIEVRDEREEEIGFHALDGGVADLVDDYEVRL